MTALSAKTIETAKPDPDEDSTRLMESLSQGDTSALTGLVERWKVPLCSFFYRSVHDQHDAEELALETLTRIFRSAHSYQPNAPFPAYLFRIARNLLISHLRKSGPRLVSLSTEAIEPSVTDYQADQNETQEWLKEGLRQLPEKLRTPLLLHAQQGLSYEMVSQTLHIPLSLTKIRIFRARQKLRQILNRLPS
jgi:RNA polymerase sigma-70 factor (ECF subfamily)